MREVQGKIRIKVQKKDLVAYTTKSLYFKIKRFKNPYLPPAPGTFAGFNKS